MRAAAGLRAQRHECPWLGVFLLPDGLKASKYMFFAVLFAPPLILAIRVLATGGWPTERRDARLD